jgi:hypothetical protein
VVAVEKVMALQSLAVDSAAVTVSDLAVAVTEVVEEAKAVEKEDSREVGTVVAVDYPEHNCDMFCLPNV